VLLFKIPLASNFSAFLNTSGNTAAPAGTTARGSRQPFGPLRQTIAEEKRSPCPEIEPVRR
jgi:hypothetical protein